MQNEKPGCMSIWLNEVTIKLGFGWLYLVYLLCGVTPALGAGWGQNATLTPGWERIGTAARNAMVSPGTWAPAAGALILQIDNVDRKIQKWAALHTPVFGSQENADRKSDNLRDISGAMWLVSALAAPSTDEEGEWIGNKAKGLGVQFGAGALLRQTVGVLKETTNRDRPNNLGSTSFPSAHASSTSLYATLTSKNIGTMGWSDSAVSASRFGLSVITVSTAWARVEANQHYPSDVLAGIALGHFFGAFFTEAFLGIDDPELAQVSFEPARNGYLIQVRFGF